ncbi:hypothetical protein D3C76_165260 [compost metagenome]
MNIEQLRQALKANELETVKGELVRYGTVLGLHDWESWKGCHRLYIIKHAGAMFVVGMLNGNTTSVKEQ